MPNKSVTAAGATSITREMTLDFEGLMGILANSLYSEKKVFIRELVQNGHDSIRRREKHDPDFRGRIEIETRPDEGWISFTDNGIGMSAADLENYLARIGAGGTKQEGRNREQVKGLIGQFGIGFLSGFIVAERVEVRTRKINENQGWLWQNDGTQSYTVEACEMKAIGTVVRVFIKDAADLVLLGPDEVTQVVREYCDMLLVPIHINRGLSPVNTQTMPWERDGISDDERDIDCRVYLAKTIRGDSLIKTFPVRLDEPLTAGGILFISKLKTFGVPVPRNVLIYQDRMFVANDAEILPPWALFVSGIIETSQLTPNASRDGFIRNKAWSDLREALGDFIIRSMEHLAESDRRQLSYILKFHDLGIKAACHQHETFFQKFAHLLEWRVNRLPNDTSVADAEDLMNMDMRSGGVSYHWRTLPEVLAATPGEPGRAKRLLTFTTSNSANQYFEMANSGEPPVLVVDASYPFEDELIAAYPKLPNAPLIDLVYVDRQGVGLFKDLIAGDEKVRNLADAMSQFILPGGNGRLKVEARRFEPATLPGVVLNAERGNAEQTARQMLQDPNSTSSVREMAEELLRTSRAANAMRMTINASSSFIQELAKQDYRDTDVRHLMLGVYNCAILYNAELLTPQTAKIFHDQFGEHMKDTLTMISERASMKRERTAIESEREAMRQLQGNDGPTADYRIIFLMTPFSDDYSGLEQALRSVVEDRYGCQLSLARDRVLHPELRANVENHMRQAHAYIAEVSLGNPNVLYEIGRARALHLERPMILLTHAHPGTGKIELPADLQGLLHIDYSPHTSIDELAEQLDRELRKSQALSDILNDKFRDEFIPISKIKQHIRPFDLTEPALNALTGKFATANAWNTAKAEMVHQVVAAYGVDEGDAANLLRKVQKGISKK